MCLFLVLLWCWAAVPGSANLIPVWAGANSRFAPLREFVGNGLIWLTVFAAKRRWREQNRRNSGFDGNNGNSARTAAMFACGLS
jgi:hypothetical protein